MMAGAPDEDPAALEIPGLQSDADAGTAPEE